MTTRYVTCAFDGCHSFETTSPNAKFCVPCGCKRQSDLAARRAGAEALFDEPQTYRVLPISNLPDGYRVAILNDTQIPFQDVKTLAAVERFLADFKPNLEIYNGDIIDFYTISTFDQNPSRAFRLQDELDAGKAWLYGRAEANPDTRRILIEGNHEDRLRRWLWRHGPELSGLRALTPEALLGLDEAGIERVNYRSIVDLHGFRIEHGYKTTGSTAYPTNVSRWMAIATGSSGLCGHTHRFSVYSWTDARGSHSYIENGALCQLALEYAPFPNWQHAFTYGIIQKGKLHVMPVQIYDTGFQAEGEFYAR